MVVFLETAVPDFGQQMVVFLETAAVPVPGQQMVVFLGTTSRWIIWRSRMIDCVALYLTIHNTNGS